LQKKKEMPIYLLIPLHTSDRAWSLAARRDPIQVIAPTEAEARSLASLSYGIPSRDPSLTILEDPWLHSRLVYVHAVEESDTRLPLLESPRAESRLEAEQTAVNTVHESDGRSAGFNRLVASYRKVSTA
jgi:hypothetical protein